MPFSSFGDFRQHLNSEARSLTGKSASSHKTPLGAPDQRGVLRAWWTSTRRTDGRSELSLNRNKAYLRTYFSACGRRFSATGIRFANSSFIRPDRSVMERSLRDGHVTFDDRTAHFQITDSGLAFLGLSEGRQ